MTEIYRVVSCRYQCYFAWLVLKLVMMVTINYPVVPVMLSFCLLNLCPRFSHLTVEGVL